MQLMRHRLTLLLFTVACHPDASAQPVTAPSAGVFAFIGSSPSGVGPWDINASDSSSSDPVAVHVSVLGLEAMAEALASEGHLRTASYSNGKQGLPWTGSRASWASWYRVGADDPSLLGTPVSLQFDLVYSGLLTTVADAVRGESYAFAYANAQASFQVASYAFGAPLAQVTYTGSASRDHDYWDDGMTRHGLQWTATDSWTGLFDGTTLHAETSLMIPAVVGGYVQVSSSIVQDADTNEDSFSEFGYSRAQSAAELDAWFSFVKAEDAQGSPFAARLQGVTQLEGAVPEPGAWALLTSSGLLGVAIWRRRTQHPD